MVSSFRLAVVPHSAYLVRKSRLGDVADAPAVDRVITTRYFITDWIERIVFVWCDRVLHVVGNDALTLELYCMLSRLEYSTPLQDTENCVIYAGVSECGFGRCLIWVAFYTFASLRKLVH